MKRIAAITILLAGILGSAFSQNQNEAKSDEKIAQLLKQFESDWLTANLNQDKRWLERFFAGKLIVVPFENDAVKIRKRETVEMIDPKLKPDEMKVRISGNVTLLTNGGNRFFYFLDTFNKRDGKWQVIAAHFSQTPQQTSENTEQTIMQTEREFIAMRVKKDIVGLKQIVADDFSGADSSGKGFSKAQFINEIESGESQSNSFEDLKARVYGNTAVVTGQLSVKNKKNKTDDISKLLFTNVWVMRDGQWQIVSHQATQIK